VRREIKDFVDNSELVLLFEQQTEGSTMMRFGLTRMEDE